MQILLRVRSVFASGTVLATFLLAFISPQSAAQIISTIIGGGPLDGTTATLVGMPAPVGIEADTSGNVYVSS